MRIAKSIPDLNEPLTDEEWNRLWGTNVKGGYDLIRLVVPGMIQNKKEKSSISYQPLLLNTRRCKVFIRRRKRQSLRFQKPGE